MGWQDNGKTVCKLGEEGGAGGLERGDLNPVLYATFMARCLSGNMHEQYREFESFGD